MNEENSPAPSSPVSSSSPAPSPVPLSHKRSDKAENKKPLTVLEELDQKFGSAKSKPEIVKALESCQVLHRIPLPEPSVSLEQALKDFYREKVLLNDVAFVPDRHDTDRSHGFSQTVYVLIEKLTRDTSVYNVQKYGTPTEVGNHLMQRACRTSAGSDSFFTVQKMLCTEGTFLTQKTMNIEPPVLIDIFLAPRPATAVELLNQRENNPQDSLNESSSPAPSLTENPSISNINLSFKNQNPNNEQNNDPNNDNNNQQQHQQQQQYYQNIPLPSMKSDLCARVQVTNCFAIFDVESIDEIMGVESEDPIPWLDIESVVIDESNFSAGTHWRKLHLIVTNPETGVTYSSNESLNSLTEAVRQSGRLSGRRVFQDLSSWLNPNHRPLSQMTTQQTDETLTTHSSMVVARGDQHSDGSSSNNSKNSRLSKMFRW